ncbi:hypothetical protein IWX84_002598 [Flavobacterium sp. CG_9.10]|uniref:hypothetical protein n=1 Tax=Flavobacterium sp. CG_9.10 TaxID=2787729 RepID=UPI0018CA9E0C|nr:hypothetical protein [Flavobacterium sp. CG_9.10]MBG6111710.1 hypothetical protein [Flavobacterium sp. CG_9.10]
MAKKNKPSHIKRIKIQSNELIRSSDKGRFFSIKSHSPERLIASIRFTTLPEFYNVVLKELEKHPNSAAHLLNSKKKKKIEELDSPKLFFSSFESEFVWAKNILLKNFEALNQFVLVSEKFSDVLINGNLKDAAVILEDIEREFGFSLWLIKNKIAYLQLVDGLEAQKRYTQSIKNKLKDTTLPRFITHWVSVRNEKQTSSVRYRNRIQTITNRMTSSKQLGFREYINYHLLAVDDLDPERFIHVLRLEYSSSLIDYYEAFVALLRVLSVNPDDKLKSKVFNLVGNNNFLINDNRIEHLSVLLGVKKGMPNEVNNYLNNRYNLIFTGNNSTNSDLTLQTLENPIALIADSYEKALINNSNKNFKSIDINSFNDLSQLRLRDILIDKLSKVIQNGIVNSSEEFNELNKIAMNFASFPWASAINIQLIKENVALSKLKADCEIFALKIPYIHSDLIDCIADIKLARSYEDLCVHYSPEGITTKFYISLKDLNENAIPLGLTQDYNNLLRGLIEFNINKPHDAIIRGEELKKSNNSYFKRRGYSIISYSHLKINDLKMACFSVAECYVKERHFYPFLPLEQILKLIKPGTAEWKTVNSFIDFSIVLDAYFKHINTNLETERRFAYEDFLLKNGMEKPSELVDYINKFDKNKIIYYLRFICIETIMDTSGAFNGGSEEVVTERLTICRLLLTIDSVNSNVYKQEINDLVKKQVITSRKQEVDQSRIYVDIQSIKNWAESELDENFNRYIAYLKNNLNILENKSQSSNILIQSNDLSMNIPENEVNALLKFMIQEITDAYLSPDFGLDRFLSTRIRHGILEGHLRRPIQNHELITKREFKNGPYLRNDYWLKKINPTSGKLLKHFDSAFSKFSESYDKLIYEANEWLQINKQNGLFNFSVQDDDLNTISTKISQETSLNDFVDLIINALDSSLILQLISIRDALNKNSKIKAKKLLNELYAATHNIGNSNSLELQAAINQARTDVQAQFDKIIEWFVPPSSGNTTPYFIEDAMMVAEAIIKETDPEFKIEVTTKEENEFSIHGQLPIFVDIFVNIFENVVKRSGLENPEAKIKIWCKNISDDFTVINFKIIVVR